MVFISSRHLCWPRQNGQAAERKSRDADLLRACRGTFCRCATVPIFRQVRGWRGDRARARCNVERPECRTPLCTFRCRVHTSTGCGRGGDRRFENKSRQRVHCNLSAPRGLACGGTFAAWSLEGSYDRSGSVPSTAHGYHLQ